MTAECLYQNIKQALDFFDLSWGEKDKITVKAKENAIEFSYEDRSITIQVR